MSDTPRPDAEPDDTSTATAARSWPEPSAEERRRWHINNTLTNLVIRRVVEELGPDGVTYAPDIGLEAFGDQPQPDPVVAVRAARELQWAAARLLGEHLDRARGRGVPWRDLATALGIADDADEEGIAPAEAAFHLATTGRIDGDLPHRRWGDEPYRSWRCASCRAWVHDRGPFNGHPDDDETGHASGCARHAADIAAWRRRMDAWDDDPEDDDAAEDRESDENGSDWDGES
jgi:hypothetical protein